MKNPRVITANIGSSGADIPKGRIEPPSQEEELHAAWVYGVPDPRQPKPPALGSIRRWAIFFAILTVIGLAVKFIAANGGRL